jgi:dTDP-4-amino-4,6-dideoxygalactose transaminase
MVEFNIPPFTGDEVHKVEQAMRGGKLSGDGPFTRSCHGWFEAHLPATKTLLTTSCTHALEMTAFLLGIGEGDEVIMPSFTFVSTANAFAVRGARIVFVDVEPRTMNISAEAVAKAISTRTRAIVVVHYAGVACDMDAIGAIAAGHGIPVVEDAAQGFMARYKGRMLGTLGVLGCYSFHETKNISCGEGGLLVINDTEHSEGAEILREKGTNRARFFRGLVDKYTWVGLGSSYLPSELNAAYLFSQLENVGRIQADRMGTWDRYYEGLCGIASEGRIELPFIPEGCEHNAHMFFIKCKDLGERTMLMEHLKAEGISSAFHYVPLHSSPQGLRTGVFHGTDRWTTRESERLLRLPLWYGISTLQVDSVVAAIKEFYFVPKRANSRNSLAALVSCVAGEQSLVLAPDQG